MNYHFHSCCLKSNSYFLESDQKSFSEICPKYGIKLFDYERTKMNHSKINFRILMQVMQYTHSLFGPRK